MSGEPLDDFERMADEIKANPDKYRPLDQRLTCPEKCYRRTRSSPVTLSTIYAGPDGRLWLWVAGSRGPTNEAGFEPGKVVRWPPRALAVPDGPGQPAGAQIAQCPRCRAGYLLLPQIGRVDVRQLAAPTHATVADD